MATITKTESDRRSKLGIYNAFVDTYSGPCEHCGDIKPDLFEDTDFAVVCNKCYWIRTDRTS